MLHKSTWGLVIAGTAAGAVSGFFGAGGGMVLVPLLGRLTELPEQELFPASIRIMVPLCLLSLVLSPGPLPVMQALPYLLGSLAGGLISGKLSGRMPSVWLHRGLGLLILLGGGRMLWN